MTLKERIMNDYTTKPMIEYTVFQTNPQELSRMYDEVVEVVKTGEDFKRFLAFKGATNAEGKIRFDRISDYIDPEDRTKKVQKVKVVFKYPVYNFFYTQYKTAMGDIKEKEKLTPLPNES